jgi:GntR family transcriptional repressor for pyruvate dehydrogenase complex
MLDTAGPSLSQVVHRRLLRWLEDSAFPADTRLPSENELARRFAVSRPVLRQALAQLGAEGRIHTRKGAGTFIRAPILAPPALRYDALANIPDVQRFLEFRCAIEGEIAAAAALQGAQASFTAIQRAQRALDTAIAAGQPGIEEDLALHAAIASASGNRFFTATLQALGEQTRFSIRLTRELTTRPASDRMAEIRREHALICDAVIGGDPAAARTAMQDHLRGGIQRLFGR